MAKRRIVKSGTSENIDSLNVSGPEPETGAGGKIVESDVELSPRLNLPLTAEGFFATSTMQTRSREKLVKALSDPNLSAALGVDVPKPGAAAPQVEGIPPSLLVPLWDGLSGFGVALFAKSYPAHIAALAKFTEAESTMLAGPTAKVIDKHFPNLLSKHQEEGELLAAVLVVIMGKMAVIKAAMAAQGANPVPAAEHEPMLGVN